MTKKFKKPWLEIAKSRLKEKKPFAYNTLNRLFNDEWYVYEYQTENFHSYYLWILWEEISFISIKFDFQPLVDWIEFWILFSKNN